MKSSHTSYPTSSCYQCGKSFARSDDLQRHMCNCIGRGVATANAAATTVPAPAITTTAAKPRSRLQFKLQQTHSAWEVLYNSLL